MEADYASLGTSMGPHPLGLLREQLRELDCRSSRELLALAPDQPVRVAGLVIGRQRPQTATGVTFVTLEDEFGMINVIVWSDLAERQRLVLRGSRLLEVRGQFEARDGVRHVIARQLHDLTGLLQKLTVRSRDYR